MYRGVLSVLGWFRGVLGNVAQDKRMKERNEDEQEERATNPMYPAHIVLLRKEKKT